MTPEDIEKIEQALGLEVPKFWAEIVLGFPCPESRGIREHELYDEADYLIVTGKDERVYFVDLEEIPNYETDLEACFHSGSVREYIDEAMAEEWESLEKDRRWE